MAPTSPLAEALAGTDFPRLWYRWCDRTRDWSTDATDSHDVDSLRTSSGGFAPLDLAEFMTAFRAAGATVTRGARFNPNPRHRAFTVEVDDAGTTVCTEIHLGRGLNSLECGTAVVVDGVQQGSVDLLHSVARRILQSRGEPDPDPQTPYPRPIISSRSHLEVCARELVEVMGQVARDWTDGRASRH